jgi:hypothetical protein
MARSRRSVHCSSSRNTEGKANSAFVAAMEDVLEVYPRPHDPERPPVCLDESSKQLIAETRVTIVLVQDNLNIRCEASLYEAFRAVEARRLVERFEWHYTPKYGN